MEYEEGTESEVVRPKFEGYEYVNTTPNPNINYDSKPPPKQKPTPNKFESVHGTLMDGVDEKYYKKVMNHEDIIMDKNFIGIFPNAVNEDLCSGFTEYYNAISSQGLTMSSMQEGKMTSGILRKDDQVGMPLGLPATCFPGNFCMPLWTRIGECLKMYDNNYSIGEYLTAFDFKIHKVEPTGGYHIWHHEHGYKDYRRILAWHLTIHAPEEGGETEFLHQSVRTKPVVGQLLIWPAAFTHKHRGNPPLKGTKIYITGWFELAEPPPLSNTPDPADRDKRMLSHR